MKFSQFSAHRAPVNSPPAALAGIAAMQHPPGITRNRHSRRRDPSATAISDRPSLSFRFFSFI